MIFSLLLLLLVGILPIALVIMIITAIVKKEKNGEKSSLKSFEKSIRSIYVYIVLICLLCTIISGTIYLFNSSLNLVLPEKDAYTVNPDVVEYSTRERNKNIVGIFTSSAMLMSCVPLFIYYNKVSKKDD